MDIENLDINYAIEFLNTIGYKWDGTIQDKEEAPKTIYNFFCPQYIKINNNKNQEEYIGLQLYDECSGTPFFCIYKKHERNLYTEELNYSKEWTNFLKDKGIL